MGKCREKVKEGIETFPFIGRRMTGDRLQLILEENEIFRQGISAYDHMNKVFNGV